MDTSKLAILKDKMNKAKDFYPVWDYFLDHIGKDVAILAAGRPIVDETLTAIAAATVGECMEKPPRVFGLFLIEIPGTDFIHGFGTVDGCIATLFYFKDMGAGMLAVVQPGGRSTRLARFVGVAMERRKRPGCQAKPASLPRDPRVGSPVVPGKRLHELLAER